MYSLAKYKGMYSRHLAANNLGQPVTLMVNNGTDYDRHQVTAHVSNWREGDFVPGGSIKTGDLRLLIPADTLPSGLRHMEQKDRIEINGHVYAIINWDIQTRSIGSTLLAVEATVRG